MWVCPAALSLFILNSSQSCNKCTKRQTRLCAATEPIISLYPSPFPTKRSLTGLVPFGFNSLVRGSCFHSLWAKQHLTQGHTKRHAGCCRGWRNDLTVTGLLLLPWGRRTGCVRYECLFASLTGALTWVRIKMWRKCVIQNEMVFVWKKKAALTRGGTML